MWAELGEPEQGGGGQRDQPQWGVIATWRTKARDRGHPIGAADSGDRKELQPNMAKYPGSPCPLVSFQWQSPSRNKRERQSRIYPSLNSVS